MAINNTLNNVFTSKGKTLPVNNTVPNIISSLSPAQSALNNKTGTTLPPKLAPSTSSQNLISSSPNFTNVSTFLPKTPEVQQPPSIPQPTKGLVTPTAQNLSIGGTPSIINPNFSGVSGGSNPVQQPQTQYSGLVDLVTKSAQGNQAIGQNAADIAKNYGHQIADVGQRSAQAQAGYSTTGTTPVAEGNASVIARTAAAQQSALAQGEQAALQGTAQQLTGKGQQTSGLVSAAGLAQPSAVAPGQTTFNPLTGEFGTGAGGFDVQSTIQSLAQDVANGVKTPSQAEAMLGNNISFNAQLDQAIKQLNPNYDRVQAEAQAQARSASTLQTGTTGGQLTKSADSAKQALIKLETDFANLSSLQTGGIPATNSIANWIASNLGQGALSSYQTTLADARAQLQGVLTASGGATPTGAESMAKTYLPDNMTPAMFKEKLAAARALVDQKVGSFTTTTPISGTSTSGTIKTNYGDIDPNL